MRRLWTTSRPGRPTSYPRRGLVLLTSVESAWEHGSTIVEDEGHSVNLAEPRLGNQDSLEEGSKVEETFAFRALAVDDPNSNA